MKLIAITIAAISLAACTTTDLHTGVVREVAGSDLTSISMIEPAQMGCEYSFIAVRAGQIVRGCIYRPGLFGRLEVRWTP
jgi:hypothetical protein